MARTAAGAEIDAEGLGALRRRRAAVLPRLTALGRGSELESADGALVAAVSGNDLQQ